MAAATGSRPLQGNSRARERLAIMDGFIKVLRRRRVVRSGSNRVAVRGNRAGEQPEPPLV